MTVGVPHVRSLSFVNGNGYRGRVSFITNSFVVYQFLITLYENVLI